MLDDEALLFDADMTSFGRRYCPIAHALPRYLWFLTDYFCHSLRCPTWVAFFFDCQIRCSWPLQKGCYFGDIQALFKIYDETAQSAVINWAILLPRIEHGR